MLDFRGILDRLADYPVYSTPKFHHHLNMQTINPPAIPSLSSQELNGSFDLETLRERLLQQRQPGVPLKVLALGDSLVYGFGDPIRGGWVEQLRRQWMAPDSLGHVMYNLGIRGDGVQQVSQRLDAEFHCRGELRHRVPDVIILSVGTNGIVRTREIL